MKVLREEAASEIANIENLLRPDYDEDYHGLLKGKKIAIVGPAETVIGTRQGSMIDSCDLVVRFNTVIEYLPFSDDLARDIGARTDIIYCNNEVLVDGIVAQKEVSHARFAEICEKLSIKYMVSTNNDFTYEHSSTQSKCYEDSETFQRFLQTQNIETRFRMLFAASDTTSKLLSGYVGRTGFIALIDLLASGADQLYITGMTFYHKGGHLFIADHADELHPMRNHRGESPRDNSPGHNSYLELEVMKVIANTFKEKVKFDESLRNLLAGRVDE